jgi:hypothetical protein
MSRDVEVAVASWKPATNDGNVSWLDTSTLYPVALSTAFQFATKEVCVGLVAASATGAVGAVRTFTTDELTEEPDAFAALTR